jgi:hypothetical protein
MVASAPCASLAAHTAMAARRLPRQAWPAFLARPGALCIAAFLLVFTLPPIPGLGTAGRFQFELQDRAGRTPEELAAASQQFLAAASQRPELIGLFTGYRTTVRRHAQEVKEWTGAIDSLS